MEFQGEGGDKHVEVAISLSERWLYMVCLSCLEVKTRSGRGYGTHAYTLIPSFPAT